MPWLPLCRAWRRQSCACKMGWRVRRQVGGGGVAVPEALHGRVLPRVLLLLLHHCLWLQRCLCDPCKPLPLPPGDQLVPLTAIGAGGGLTAHVSRTKANSLVGTAGQQWPALGRLAVRHTGCAFLLTAQPSFHLMQRLTVLRWGCRMQRWHWASFPGVLAIRSAALLCHAAQSRPGEQEARLVLA